MGYTFLTKPKGIHATFVTTCECRGELTISNGRIEWHECRNDQDN